VRGFDYPFLTSKERDIETGLDYFLARYYSSAQGRFTSPDEFSGGPDELFILGSGEGERQALVYANVTNPQTLNKYQYCFNNPLRYVDPDGHDGVTLDSEMGKRVVQGASVSWGPTLLADGIHRGRYDQASKAATQGVRNLLKADTRDNQSAFSNALTKIAQKSRAGQEARHTAASATRTSPFWNKVGLGSRVVGGALTAGAVVFSVYNVAAAEPGHRVEAAAVEGGAWAGAAAGSAAGAKIGGIIGSAIEPGGGTAVGIAVGSLVGGAGGAVGGSKIAEK
jgi:RHS repeat-associated protein